MSQYVNEPIAVVGSACRFPGGASSPSKLWKLLEKPRDVLLPIDGSRFKASSHYHVDGHHHGTSNVLAAYLLEEDTRTFDPQFFSIQAGEAESIDPQQRVLLETVYEGIESAGMTIEGLQNSSTAVYVGVMCDDYTGIAYHDRESIPKYAATGTARSIMSNRVSYFFNWNGPCMTIDTACSSSLVAVHQAVQILRSGESKIAVAAGTNLILGTQMFVAESNLNMLSPDSRSRMWDAGANGYARGEGVASVVLKTLSQAIADGDKIECIIRETGVNQDGRTPGITMPSSTAQAALIRSTYAKAGLDLKKKADRCQYFEAHGTGTKAGDPQEAGAIYKAFFAETGCNEADDILHVGSIKTVIGHTEGTAGIAGLLKASLAIQNKTIPPNMHFNTLNPDLEEFYDHLKVPTQTIAWPELPEGTPRRVSVNSFGFGGTNAHAIVESYEPAEEVATVSSDPVAIPFTFSAPNEKALTTQLNSYLAYLAENKDIDLNAVAWTLAKRSAFNYRVAFSAITGDKLAEKIEAKLEAKKSGNTPVGTRPIKDAQGILGVFTGQGAQWAAMGRDMILSSSVVETIIDELEQSLAELPATERPSWSLKEEMLKQGKESRISEGLMSQPLCTAVQVVLVNLLRKAGITFESVVGHSSGEIGAAYAAGYISARDAIRIAYFRGYYAKLAKGPNGENGSMLAAGTSLEDANELCSLESLEGRIQVAASNSSSSVTLSGDEDAIEEALEILKDEQKFARQLKVDTAYHSHHMKPCSEAYTQSLKDCKIQILTPTEGCTWFSSVFGGKVPDADDGLDSVYWMKNMLQPVLFSQALTAALANNDAPAIAMEVGPHPALKGPATATIEEILGHNVPYAGTLSRNANDIEAFADSLGFLWTCFGPATPKFAAFDEYFSNDASAQKSLLKDIPRYTWDHDRVYFFESRQSRQQRQRAAPTHELLGTRCEDEVDGELRFRNYIRPSEIPYLSGHNIQGQMLFPAAGFAVMAIEASKLIVSADEVELIELHDFSCHRALAFPDEAAGVETLFTLANIKKGDGVITANFMCDASPNKDQSLASVSNGKLVLRLGQQSESALPDRNPAAFELKEVDVDDFYTSLAHIGYNYQGIFQGISSLSRATDISAGTIYIPDDDYKHCDYIIHPSTLDVGFQALFGAIGAPGDGRLWTLHVPTLTERIKINPRAFKAGAALGVELPFDATLAQAPAGFRGFTGDVAIYDESGKHCLVSVERLSVSPLGQPTKADDRPIFGETSWMEAEPNCAIGFEEWVETDVQKRLGAIIDRACFFYLKQAYQTITPAEREECDFHRKAVLNWAEHLVDLTSRGVHPHLNKEWMNDTEEIMRPMMMEMAVDYPDMEKLMFNGDRLLPFVRGELSLLEEFRTHDLLDWLYKGAEGTTEYNTYTGYLVKQLAHRFPYMNILEIGAGTGSATEAVLGEIGHSYSSYTFTDISAGFFPDAANLFKEHVETNGMSFKVLDVEKDPKTQGFEEGKYDLIIACNVLHATKFLDETIKNSRKLLRAGGYLVLMEITDVDWLRTGFMLSGMHGWWAGAEDGRPYTPIVNQDRWDGVFRRNGFSGIDTATPPSKSFMAPFSVMVTQAVDAQMEIIRKPLAAAAPAKPVVENLLIIGGQEASTCDLAEEIENLVRPFTGNITQIDTLEELDVESFNASTSVLCLTELDKPVFKAFTEERHAALQAMMDQGRNILWIVKGAKGENPYSRMIFGLARCLVGERRDGLTMQIIDVAHDDEPEATMIAEALIRMHVADSWKKLDKPYDPLWTLEREVHVAKGVVEIPRYQPAKVLETRYNASRRQIKTLEPLITTTVEITSDGSSYEIEEYLPAVWDVEAAQDARLTTIRVKRSVLTAVKVKSVGCLFLVVGEDVKTHKKVLALSEKQRSQVSVPKSWAVSCDVSEELEASLLLAAADELLADAILGKSTGSFLVHEPTTSLAQVLTRKAAEKKASVAFTTTSSENASFRLIHKGTSQTAISSYVPKGVTSFVNLATSVDADSTGARIAHQLPGSCKCKAADAFFSAAGFSTDSSKDLSKVLDNCVAQFTATGATTAAASIALKDVTECRTGNECLRTINWAADASVPVNHIVAEHKVTLRDDKTYWLIGATGELGLSIVKWMVDRGAKYIVLTSRNPKVDQGWLDTITARGAIVKVWASDICSRSSMRKTYKQICDTLPPIAGVANAAMVLSDGLYSNISYEKFAKTLKPKVDGTTYLDELFPKNTLDFFIIFSSLTYVTGNVGQTPYAAANAFMVSLAEGRRKRGLAASVMSLAGIFGVGYIARTDSSIHDKLGAMGYAHISEWDYQQFFAEAVIAGHPSSGRNFEISNGVKGFDPERDTDLPFWLNIPRFAKFKVIKANLAASKSDKKTVATRALLKEQTNEDGVRQTLLDGFLATLYQKLNMLPEDNGITPESSLVELGIDSLVAVDMRSWFHSELEVDMPVLKILSGATVAAMVDDCFTRLPRDMIPKFKEEKTEEKPEEKTEEKKEEAAKAETSDQSEETSSESSSVVMVSSQDSLQGTTTPPTSQGSLAEEKVDLVPVKTMPTFEKTERMAYGSSQFWFLSQYLEDRTPFNVQFTCSLKGSVNVGRMERAVEALGQRHESFRTAFYANPDRLNEPTQGVMANSQLHLEFKKIKSIDEVEQNAQEFRDHVFDLERGEVIRALLMSLNPKTHFMVFGFHHIAIDGYGFNLFLSELNALYTEQRLPPVKMQFSDFAKKQREEVENGSMAKELEFWKQQFTTIPPPLPLFPMAKVNSRQIMTSYEQEESEEIAFDEKTMNQIKELCRQTGATKFHFFLACLKIFLFRYLDVDDLCIGLADANRGDTDFDLTMGYLLNLLPLRFQRDDKQDFAAAVKEARETAHSALTHSRIPFDLLLDNLDIPRSATSTPLFQVFMDYRQINATMPLLGAQSFGKQLPGRVGYDLMLDITDIAGHELRVNFKTQKKLYSESSANILLKSFLQLVKSIASNAKVQLNKVPVYNAADVKTAIELGSGPSIPLVWPVTMSHRIEEMTLANADSIALKDGVGNSYTYAAMAKRVNAVASALTAGGAKEGSLVAVFQEPTADWIVSLQAIWKIGGVYVPLELRNGLTRLAMIVADAKPDAVLCHAQTAADVSELNPGSASIINVSEVANIKKTILTKATPQSPAMVLYSSGTTGTPKGIVIPHYALRNFIEVSGERYGISKENILQQTAYSFDLAISEVLFGLGNGGSLYVASVTQRMDPVEITDIIAKENISFTVATPSEYSAWIRFGAETLAGSNWKIAKTIGEALTQELALKFRSLKKSDLRLINFYGPAEITIACHVGVIDYNSDEPITIGYTLPNYQSYIMDRNLEPVPIGVSGEIVIGGAGVTMGYLNNEKLTNRQFVPNTYAPTAEWPNLYRTGDQGRQLPDGSVVYEGRIAGDSQIKLRGIRIELKDIEATIVKVSEGTIYKAVASVRGDRDSEFIVAHAEFAGNFPESQKDEYLSGLLARLPLPKYMCPAMIIPLDAIPLNNHAKVDRRAVNAIPLPLTQSGDDSDDVLSQTELELKAVWENVISNDIADTVSIGANTDFFRIGGNSLLLVRVQAAIREVFDVVVPITAMFEATTLRAMSAKVDAATSVAVINWDRETSLEEALFKIPSKPSKAPSTGVNILLTGSTGYLGRHLLKQLVSDDRVERIHAVAIRKDNPKDMPRDVLQQSDKITAYEGNLALPMFGLPESTWSNLGSTIDVIIHSGCDRSMSDYYQVLRAGNFGSTKELTKLALGRQIPIHYISGNGVLDLENAPKTGSVATARPPTNGSNGYIASKWVSEAYLENAHKKLGLPVHIHRVVSAPEENQKPTPEVLKEFSDIAIAMNAMPDRSRWNGSFDVIYAPTLAKTICDSVVDSDADVPAFVHYEAEARLKMEEVEEYLDDRDNRRAEMDVIATHLWAGAAKKMGLEYHLASQNLVVGGPDGFALKR